MFLTVLLANTRSTFAASNSLVPGSTVNYRSSNQDHAISFTLTGYSDYEGACCEVSVERLDSGQATVVQKISNTSNQAKIAYTVYKNGWLNNHETQGHIGGNTWRRFGINLIQISYRGKSYTRDKYINDHGYSSSDCDYVEARYDSIVASTIVPSNFEVFLVDPGNGNQKFMMWRETPDGKFRLKKSSANTQITS